MSDTKTRILDVAESLVQTRGFNDFSYLDLADEVGVKHSSVHYHFKTKADLALALVKRIRERHGTAFAGLDSSLETPQQRLKAIVDFFQGYVKNGQFCMCGMMAAELQACSEEVRRHLGMYFRDFRSWATRQFMLMGAPDAQHRALSFVGAIEGSLLLARLEDDPAIVTEALSLLLDE